MSASPSPIVLIYLLIVVNFQSWLDPFVIVMALPSAHGAPPASGIHSLS
jgi:multidrug efflux pump subunit AcrB